MSSEWTPLAVTTEGIYVLISALLMNISSSSWPETRIHVALAAGRAVGIDRSAGDGKTVIKYEEAVCTTVSSFGNQ